MTTISILREASKPDSAADRAVAGKRESVGRTAGEALDALTSQLSEDEAGTIVIVQQLHPDRFFSASQRHRLADLMSRWRAARDAGSDLAPEEQAELDALVQTELEATSNRAEAIEDELSR
jgi:hypothetical protein